MNVVEGTMEKQPGGFRFTKVVLTIVREEDRHMAERALEKAERSCPVSRSLSCTVELKATIELEEPVAAE